MFEFKCIFLYKIITKQMIKHLLVILCVVLLSFTQTTCHYSCNICAGSIYSLCANCSDSANSLTVVEDPTQIPQIYWNSQSVTGVCVGKVPSDGANALGIIVFILALLTVIITRTLKAVYLFYTIQTFALVSFIEVAWLDPTNYMLQSLQYFMIFNVMGSGYKVQDQTMRQKQYYRLHEYFKESDFLSNIAIIGILNILVFIALSFFTIYQRKNYPTPIESDQQSTKVQEVVNENEVDKIKPIEIGSIKEILEDQSKRTVSQLEQKQEERQEDPKTLSESQTKIGLMITQLIFFLLIQQTLVVIMVALRFNDPSAVATMVCSILYLLMLLFFLVSTYWEPAWFFPNKPTQYICWWRKIGLPVLVIVPISVTYLLVIFLIIFAFIQSFFDFRSKQFVLASRVTFYKFIQLILIIFIMIYVAVQLNIGLLLSTQVTVVFLSICIIVLYLCLIVEMAFGVKQTYFDSKNEIANSELRNENAMNYGQVNENTQYDIGLAHNFTELEDVEEERKKVAEKKNLEEEEQKRKLQKEEEEKERKRRQEEEQEQRRRKQKEDEERRMKEEEERQRRLRQEEQIRQKQQQQREEQQRMRKQEERKRKQEEEQKRKDELQRKRMQEIQRKRKQEEQRKKREQQDRLKREEQERREREELEKIKKEEEEAKERRRKKYQGEMDPQLRKRYGF